MTSFAIQSDGTAASGSATGSDASAKKTSSELLDPLTNKETFITLLVAQLKNQNPLQPVDGIQFLSQLTQISSVEQLVNIRQDTDKMAGATQDTNGSSGSGN